MVGDDLLSVVPSACTEEDDGSNHSENENSNGGGVTFDPNAVKTELADINESQIGDPFFLSVHSDDRDFSAGATSADEFFHQSDDDGPRRSKRNRKKRITNLKEIDPNDDQNDDDWTKSSSKRKKYVVSARAINRRNNKVKNKQREARRKKFDDMTPEEREKQREQWKEEARKKRERQKHRKIQEDALATLVEDDTPRSSAKRKKVSEMTEEELEANRAKWREEARRRRAGCAQVKQEPIEDTNDSGASEPESHDDDEGDLKKKKSSSSRKSSGGRVRKKRKVKKVSEMTEEELEANRAKWREEARRRRSGIKQEPKSEASGVSEQDDDDDDWKAEKKKNTSSSRRSSSGGRRKKVHEMTEEEREIMKAKWREEARLKRARQRETMTPEAREEYLRTQREQKRLQRASAIPKIMTDEERERFNKRRNERKKLERSLLTDEEKRERAQRELMRKIEREARMTEEERARIKMRNYMSYLARKSKMTPEDIEEHKRKRKEYLEKRKLTQTEADKAKVRESIRRYRRGMNPEQKERFNRTMRESNKRRIERLIKEGKYDEWQAKRRMQYINRRLEQGKSVGKSRDYVTVTGHRPERKMNLANLTPEEKLERQREQKRRSQLRRNVKRKLAIQQMLDAGLTPEEINRKQETPEQREQRLIKARVNKARLDLRKRLVAAGATPEEIKVRLNELSATYSSARDFRPYKPRPDARRPVTQEELEILKEDLDPPPPPTKTAPAPAIFSSGPGLSSNAKITGSANTPQPKEYYATSPTSVSSCSYASGAVTPEPFTPSVTVQHQQNYSSSHTIQVQTMGHFQHQPIPSTSSMFPNQAPAPTYPQLFGAPYIGHTPAFNMQQAHSSQINNFEHDNFDSSYDAPSPAEPSPPASPPPLPGHAPNEDYNKFPYTYLPNMGNTNSTNNQSQDQPMEKPKRGRPRKGEIRLNKVKKETMGFGKRRRKIGQAYGPVKKGILRDATCEECGNSYSSIYIDLHKRMIHNPNFKNGECTLCHEKFSTARAFDRHYREKHDGIIPKVFPYGSRPFMCQDCGRAFPQKSHMELHWNYTHGPGSLRENYNRCHICGQVYKHKTTLDQHLKRVHSAKDPEHFKCARCPEAFSTMGKMNSHVEEKHPESYFPCKFCSVVKFSDLGIRFHYSKDCVKIKKEEQAKLRKEIGDNSIERLQSPCEFCGRSVGLMNMRRHYKEMHHVLDEKYQCVKCPKIFARREYYGAHLVDYHNMMPEEWLDDMRKLNVKDRSKIIVKNLNGLSGCAGVTPEVERRRLIKQKKKLMRLGKLEEGDFTEEGEPPLMKKRHRRTKEEVAKAKAAGEKRKRAPRKRKKKEEETDTDSETDQVELKQEIGESSGELSEKSRTPSARKPRGTRTRANNEGGVKQQNNVDDKKLKCNPVVSLRRLDEDEDEDVIVKQEVQVRSDVEDEDEEDAFKEWE